MDAFEGRFKSQKDSTSNWLPIPPEVVPTPRPGKCVDDSRTMSSESMTFIKMHTLMETSVSSMHGRPLLTRVNLKHLFTAITVDPQIEALDGSMYDVIFVGTDDGRVIKMVHIVAANGTFVPHTAPTVVTETQALPHGQPVRELTVSRHTQSLIVVSDGQIVSIPLHHCNKIPHCRDCLNLQDPYCAWDTRNHDCTAVEGIRGVAAAPRDQHIQRLVGDGAGVNELCRKYGEAGNWIDPPPIVVHSTRGTLASVGRSAPSAGYDNEITVTSIDGVELTNQINNHNIRIDPLVKEPFGSVVAGEVGGVISSLDSVEVGALHMGSPSIIVLMCVLFVAGLSVGVIVAKLRTRLSPCYMEHHRSQINA